jgi:phytoene dehydrogenase-like protein
MNGYRTQIFEMHDKPGGLCTSWKREGYTFDGCIHWLVGTREGSNFNRIWQELGALQGKQIVDQEEFLRLEGEDGRAFVIYTNIERLEQHMKELAPADARQIEKFCNVLRRFTRFSAAIGDPAESSGLLGKIRTGLRMLPFIPALIGYSKTSVRDFADRFTDPFLRQVFSSAFDVPDLPMIALVFTLAWMHSQDAGYPIGGSHEFARAIERRYLELGGVIRYKSRVEKILVEDDCAMGVRLTDGAEHRADIIISAADGHATIFDMLEGRYINDTIRGYYDELPIFKPVVQVSLGVARDLSNEPHMISYPLESPITVAGEPRERITVKHYCYDDTLAPEGKSVVVVLFNSDYDYWKALRQERERYDAEKRDIAIKVINQLGKRFPGIERQVEVVDVATPITTERYTGNWQGSIEGWLPTTENAHMLTGKGMEKTLPGLANFYMIGQWVEPGGGLPPAAMSGRQAIQMICREDGRPFEAQTPS